MPIVTATPRSNSNGEVVTEFLDTVSTSPITYTFPTTQEKLKIKNNGYGSLQLTVNGSVVTILPSESKEFYGSIDSFVIASSGGVQSFEVVGTNYKDEELQLTGSDVANGQRVSGSSFEKDTNGYYVLRVVDAAPFAYDPALDAKRVVQVGSKNAEEVVVFNGVLIRDTVALIVSALDVSKYKSLFIYAWSDLKAGATAIDITVDVRTPTDGRSLQTWDGTAWTAAFATIPSNGKITLLNTKLTWLNNTGFKTLGIKLSAVSAPDSGSATVKIVGVPN